MFSSCLRAPRKIDSSIGLPSLNKVVTYLHPKMMHSAATKTVISHLLPELWAKLASTSNKRVKWP